MQFHFICTKTLKEGFETFSGNRKKSKPSSPPPKTKNHQTTPTKEGYDTSEITHKDQSPLISPPVRKIPFPEYESLSVHSKKGGNMYLTSLQRGVLKALVASNGPLTLREILLSLSKRPCARKLIPQIVKLKKDGIISCTGKHESVMDIEYKLVPEWSEHIKNELV
ncbi:hypothetical protein J7W08_01685 [Methanococcoides orientis]|uniref:hypothetical protein n=1 Tax=Methanococcoides orientis TaxID=2822137 RepID=UPI001E5F2899|nr:hypothetical protein [Methanococcoides orientis]UGV41051.1 hypothetical protein J7W08_01685 [Methanococcoides orientis]